MKIYDRRCRGQKREVEMRQATAWKLMATQVLYLFRIGLVQWRWPFLAHQKMERRQ